MNIISEFYLKKLILLNTFSLAFVFFEPSLFEYTFLIIFLLLIFDKYNFYKFYEMVKKNKNFIIFILLYNLNFLLNLRNSDFRFLLITNFMFLVYIIYTYFSNYLNCKKAILEYFNISALCNAFLALLIYVLLMFSYINNNSLLTFGGRIKLFFKDPNVFASYMLISFFLCIEKSLKYKLKKYFYFTIIIFITIFITFSRATFLSLIFGLIMVFFNSHYKNKKDIIKYYLIFFIIIIFISIATNWGNNYILKCNVGRLIPFLKPNENNTLLQTYDSYGRFYSWRAGLILLKNNYLLGYGPGSYEKLSVDIQKKINTKIITPSAHNTFLRILVENGLILFLVFLFLIYIHIKNSYYRGEINYIIIISLLINMLFIDGLHFRHFWILLALPEKNYSKDIKF